MPEAIADVCTAIAGDAAPVAMLDTCALLDIIKAGHRDAIQVDVVHAALDLETRTHAPRRLWIVVMEVVTTEWHENIGGVEAEMDTRMRQLDSSHDRAREVAQRVAPASRVYRSQMETLKLGSALRTISESLLTSARVLQKDAACSLRAGERLHRCHRPAQKARQEYKDCEIFEHYLALARALQAASVTVPLFFVSSNTRDYGTPNALDSILQAELQAARMTYVTDLAWLRGQLP